MTAHRCENKSTLLAAVGSVGTPHKGKHSISAVLREDEGSAQQTSRDGEINEIALIGVKGREIVFVC
jgi:hypothetical protein